MKKIKLISKKNETTKIQGININNLKKNYCISNSHICSSNIFINNYNNYLNKSNSHLETDIYIRNLVDIPNNLPFFSKIIDKSKTKDLNLKKWNCPICLNKFSNVNLIVKTDCNHYTCIYCMYKLFLTNYKKTRCPICRNNLNCNSICLIKKKNNFSYLQIIKQMIKSNYELSIEIFGEKTIHLIKNQYFYRQTIMFNFNSKNNNWNHFMNQIYQKTMFYNIYELVNNPNIFNITTITNNSKIKNLFILKIILNNQEIKNLEFILNKIQTKDNNSINICGFKTNFLLLRKTIEDKVFNEKVFFN